MGQQLNKYHISDDGKIYRINDDGSFTSVGNFDEIEKKPLDNTVNNLSEAPFASTMPGSFFNRIVDPNEYAPQNRPKSYM